MERTAPFELKALSRDWIVGTSGKAFLQRVHRRLAQIDERRIAAHSRGVLIAERDPVGFAAAFFAATYRRVPVILANPKWGKLEWAEVGELVRPALIFGNVPLCTDGRKKVSHPRPATILIPTGGTTGGVRLAVHRWETLEAAVEGLLTFIGPGPVNNCCVLPLYHVSGLMQLMRSFLTEGRIAFPAFSDLQAGRFPVFPPATMCLSLVPTQLQRLIAQRRIGDKLSSARAIFVGGAAVPETTLQRARELKVPVVPTYGMTETAAMVSALPPDEFLAGITNAGRPLGHARIDILCPDGLTCPVEHSGRIRVSGRSLFKGYHGKIGRNAKEPFLTNDEGYIDSVGRLHIVGRADRIIISGGEKIDPTEIERVLLQTGGIRHALVVGMPDPDWGQQVVAFYVAAGIENEMVRWEKEIRSELSHYKVPKVMMRVPRLPLDGRGKVDHRRIEALLAKRVAAG